MDAVRIGLTGDRQAGLRFEEFPDALYEDLRRTISTLGDELLALIEAATPSRTGELRSKERLRIFTDTDRITAYVDVAADGRDEIVKAAALEYGAHKKTNVQSHSKKLDHVFDRALSAPMDVLVKAYTRTPNIAEHAFLRGPLAAMRGQAFERLNAVVEQAVAGANE